MAKSGLQLTWSTSSIARYVRFVLVCALLLLRGYGRSRARLLLWCGLCFLALTADNVIVFVDLVLLPEVDLAVYSTFAALIGAILLLYGLVWEIK